MNCNGNRKENLKQMVRIDEPKYRRKDFFFPIGSDGPVVGSVVVVADTKLSIRLVQRYTTLIFDRRRNVIIPDEKPKCSID